MLDDGRLPSSLFRCLSLSGRRFGRRIHVNLLRRWMTPAILQALLKFALGAAVVIEATLIGLLLAVGFATAEWTPQVQTSGIARIGNEEDAAMATVRLAAAQLCPFFDYRTQQPYVLTHQIGDRLLAMPVWAKFKVLLDLYCIKPRLWLKMRNLTISSSYTIGTSLPRA